MCASYEKISSGQRVNVWCNSQHELLSSEREDLKVRIETLQSNVTQLQSHILELQKMNGGLEKQLEAERLVKEQKAKVHLTVLDLHHKHFLLNNVSAWACFTGPSVCCQTCGGASGSAKQTQTSTPADSSGTGAVEKGKFNNMKPAPAEINHLIMS